MHVLFLALARLLIVSVNLINIARVPCADRLKSHMVYGDVTEVCISKSRLL
jgi:hypothetical protein